MFWPSAHYLYVMNADIYYKIGISRDPTKRLKECQTGNPHYISLYAQVNCKNEGYARWLEEVLHNHFHRYHYRGEWYQNLRKQQFVDAVNIHVSKLDPNKYGDFIQAAAKMDLRGWPNRVYSS